MVLHPSAGPVPGVWRTSVPVLLDQQQVLPSIQEQDLCQEQEIFYSHCKGQSFNIYTFNMFSVIKSGLGY